MVTGLHCPNLIPNMASSRNCNSQDSFAVGQRGCVRGMPVCLINTWTGAIIQYCHCGLSHSSGETASMRTKRSYAWLQHLCASLSLKDEIQKTSSLSSREFSHMRTVSIIDLEQKPQRQHPLIFRLCHLSWRTESNKGVHLSNVDLVVAFHSKSITLGNTFTTTLQVYKQPRTHTMYLIPEYQLSTPVKQIDNNLKIREKKKNRADWSTDNN